MKKYREVESELKRVSDNVEMCSFQMSFGHRRSHATLLPAHVATTVKLKVEEGAAALPGGTQKSIDRAGITDDLHPPR